MYGNIISLIEKAWDSLRPHLAQTRLTGAGKFGTRVMYLELACREALINAIAHRDYSQEGGESKSICSMTEWKSKAQARFCHR